MSLPTRQPNPHANESPMPSRLMRLNLHVPSKMQPPLSPQLATENPITATAAIIPKTLSVFFIEKLLVASPAANRRAYALVVLPLERSPQRGDLYSSRDPALYQGNMRTHRDNIHPVGYIEGKLRRLSGGDKDANTTCVRYRKQTNVSRERFREFPAAFQ